MGLAASQARLLMLTSRKDDVESGIMALANQKLSLARKSSDISKEYSNALNATKLMWNNGSAKDVDLTYGLLMNYSEANENNQYMLSDNYGRAVLNDTYANLFGGAAKNGGANSITITKSQFLQNEMGIDSTKADAYVNAFVPKSSATIAASSTIGDINYNDTDIFVYLRDKCVNYPDGSGTKPYFGNPNAPNTVMIGAAFDSYDTKYTNLMTLVNAITGDTTDALSNELGLTDDNKFNEAVGIAMVKTKDHYEKGLNNALGESAENQNSVSRTGINTNWVDTTQMVKTFLTYFDQEYGIKNSGSVDENSNKPDNSIGGIIQNIVTGAANSVTAVNYAKTTRSGSTDGKAVAMAAKAAELPGQGEADFYMNMYDYVKANGWTRSSGIDKDKGEYLQNQIQNGAIHLYKYAGDPDPTDHVPQSLWDAVSTGSEESLMSKVSNEDLITTAEAKYNSQKDELDYKERQLDLQMTNLDTERSALDTEVDSVKTVLNKNIERSFKLFQNA